MAQIYRMMLGTSGKQWEQLTVKDDGAMTMTFHGTDREISHEVTENADGWLCYPGAMFPGLKSGRWQLMDDVVETNTNDTNSTNEVAESETTTDNTDCTDNHAEAEECESPIINEPIPSQQQMNLQTEVTESPIINEPIPSQPRPRRQRKPRVERQEPLTIDHSPLTIHHSPLTVNHQTSSTLKALGMVAAATVTLFVIYETGLLIPLGLIGLATGGVLK